MAPSFAPTPPSLLPLLFPRRSHALDKTAACPWLSSWGDIIPLGAGKGSCLSVKTQLMLLPPFPTLGLPSPVRPLPCQRPTAGRPSPPATGRRTRGFPCLPLSVRCVGRGPKRDSTREVSAGSDQVETESGHCSALRFTEEEMSWKFLGSLKLREQPQFTPRPLMISNYLT